ncbi:MAG: trehalose-phosphatase [Anaerolineales bacterium]|jgi:trehalose 6-phosphate phosphatase
MMFCDNEHIYSRLASAERLWLFLDYDGTLAEFAPTPDHVEPRAEVLEVVNELVALSNIRVTVISGRRLSHVKSLLPIEGIMLAGTYGVELQTSTGRQINRLDFNSIRPTLDRIKPAWSLQIFDKQGFYLEDKGWSLAIHAKDAKDNEAAAVLSRARQIAEKSADKADFRILGGHKFLEIGPTIANKGKAVEYLIAQYPWPGALCFYIGDDDKDEEAFGTVHDHGGFAAVVAADNRESQADCRLRSPQEARQWLHDLTGSLGSVADSAKSERSTK